MADVRPFRGWRYDFTRSGPPDKVLAPPYDVIVPAEAQRLRAWNAHHVAHLILGLPPEQGRHPEEVYVCAAERAQSFKSQGALLQDPAPCFYRLTQEYVGPDGARRRRHGLIGALRLHEFSEGIVLPHEETFAKPVDDRLRLMRHARMSFCQVFGLLDDDSGVFGATVEECAGPALFTMTDTDGATHSLAMLDDPSAIERVASAIAPLRVFIADGHHRYTASLAYWHELGCPASDDPELGAAAFISVCLSDMGDPGLGLFATHRLLKRTPALRPEYVPPGVSLTRISGSPAGADLVHELAHAGAMAFAIVTRDDTWLASVGDRDRVDAAMAQDRSRAWRGLDLAVLHAFLLPALLRDEPALAHDEENFLFSRDADDAVSRARAGEVAMAVLTLPPTFAQLREVCGAGERMPHKSTYFYPKVISGAVCRDLTGGVSNT